MPGTLYLVATPIGNLQDITFRALEVLRAVDLIAAEDTRHSQKLLNHYRISNKLVSYHEHNENERAEQLVDMLVAGRSIAVISDAGTPGICDPGSRLTERAIEAGASVVSIPGPSAFVSGLITSGLPTDAFFFGGFLPSKQGERRRRLEEVKDMPGTLVFYETPHRIERSLKDCLEVLGERRAAVARELTKVHEEIRRGLLSELLEHFGAAKVKGEIVLIIDRKAADERPEPSKKAVLARIAELEAGGLNSRAALKAAAKEFGIAKAEAYKFAKIK